MAGFPARITRSALGPTLVNAYPVENPEQDVGAETLNPAFWQLAGLNRVSGKALLAAVWDGVSAFTITAQEEAWNPNGTQARPVLARTSAGVYTYTFASSYLDESGASIAPGLSGAICRSAYVLSGYADRTIAEAWIAPASPLIVQIRQWNSSGTVVDRPFVLQVF